MLRRLIPTAALFLAATLAAPGQSSNGPLSYAGKFAQHCSAQAKSNSSPAMRDLERGEQITADSWCSATIMGIADGFAEAEIATSYAFKTGYCIRDGYSAAQLKEIVLQFIAAHPAKNDMRIAEVTLEALRDKLPCATK